MRIASTSTCVPLARKSLRRIVAGMTVTLLVGLACLLAGCGSNTTTIDRYGGSLNHLHDMLALHGAAHTVLLASHLGLYRTADDGQSWQEVAGGSGQAMDGLMLFKLAQSPVDVQRVYVLAIPRPDNPKAARATPGVYTSDDAGRTWTLAAALSAFPSSGVYSLGTGATGPGEVFVTIPSLGNVGVYASDDTGKHWHALPPVPTGNPSGILGNPAQPQRLYLWSVSDGLFTSGDGGMTWSRAGGVSGGIFSVSVAGDMVYASGGSGLYVSSDGGATFRLTDARDTFSAVAAGQSNPMHAYALTGDAVYVSADGGLSWKSGGATSRSPGVLTVDPANASTAYVGFSYPIGVAMTTSGGTSWHNVLS